MSTASYKLRRRLLVSRAAFTRKHARHLRQMIRDIQLQLLWIRCEHYGTDQSVYIAAVRYYSRGEARA